MEKFNKILKHTLAFLAVFLILNYLIQSCTNKEEELPENSGNLIFTTTETQYSRFETVTVKMVNSTNETITIKNDCPNEPFTVYKYEDNNWVKKEAAPELKCENITDAVIEPGDKKLIPYDNWNHALFFSRGRFKIEFTIIVGGEEKTFTTNEFLIVKEGILRQLAVGLFYRPIYNGLIFLAAVSPNHSLGLAIILLTLIIRTILLVPSHKAMKSQKRLQEIQPRLEKIKEKHKGDQQKVAMETMALWKETKVNPFGSCLPILLQFPFLIALFYVIRGGLNPDNAFLLYSEYSNFTLQDISVNFLGLLDLTKMNIYVLPLIVGGLQFAQMKLSLAKKQQTGKKNEMAMASNMMTYILPVMIAVFTASLPAGVGLYWGTSTIYGIVQQIIINKSDGQEKDKNEPTVRVIG